MDAQGSDNEFEHGYVIGEAKKWDRPLDKSVDNHDNPSYQIFNYVDRLRVQWGVLTNGKKWRLYSYEDCDVDTYYEFDLVEQVLENQDEEEALNNFRYFYLFFRQEAFLPSENSFLNTVLTGSINYAQGLEDDLEDDIYTALEVTARGFFEANDIEKTEENIEQVHHASLIFLYRILFILNAESRELLPIQRDEYRNILSLQHLKEGLQEEDEDTFGEGAWVWRRRIKPLFDAINDGEEYGDFKITGYNGGLFDPEKHEFLDQHQLHGKHIQKVMSLLAESTDEETGEKVLVDYRDLNIRHLGSVYEGLLEHELQQAEQDLVLENGEWKPAEQDTSFEDLPEEQKVEEGQVYITNESGERKATGSYYTPEYIVEYIVENTVGPKVDQKISEAEDKNEILDKVKELNICDPAMGSGHFLTEATSYMARRVIDEAQFEEQEVDEDNEFVWVKRQIVQEAIYGVDINPLAVELGKLSLWIETMARGQPLGFLDHHLKVGNSLVGSDFDEIFHHPTEKQKSLDNDRFMFGSPDELKQKFQKKYREIEEMPEKTKKQVAEKEEEYNEFKESRLYRQIRQLANVHTRQYFEQEVDSSDYESILFNIGTQSLPQENTDWFKKAQTDAQQRNYFHWQIEFPQVFFGEQSGFDSVIGNPPYITIGGKQEMKIDDETEEYYRTRYESSEYKPNTFCLFYELALSMTKDEGMLSYIVPRTLHSNHYFRNLRKLLISETKIRELIKTEFDVFEDAETGRNSIGVFQKSDEGGGQNEVEIIELESKAEFVEEEFEKTMVEQSFFQETPSYRFTVTKPERMRVLSKTRNSDSTLGNIVTVNNGVNTGNAADVLIHDEKKGEEFRKFIEGKNIHRFGIEWSGKWIKYDPSLKNRLDPEDLDTRQDQVDFALRDPSIFESPKIAIRQTSDSLIGGINRENYVSKHSTHVLKKKENTDLSYETILALFNSELLNFIYQHYIPEDGKTFAEVKTINISPLPISKPSADTSDQLKEMVEKIEELKNQRFKINTSIQDYLGEYSEGNALKDLYTPASGVSDTPLTDTASDREKLQVGSVETDRDGESVVLKVSARYKPENEDLHDTDRWGYTETELYSVMDFHDLSEMETALIEEFVPVAVEEAGGFAGFRSNATKTKSLVDRLKQLTLPKLEDVEDDLQRFIEQKEEAEELEQKIEKTDEQINEIVYDLYDLTEEEIEIVENAVQ